MYDEPNSKPALIQKRSEIKFKKKFFLLKVSSDIKIQNKQKSFHI